MAIGHIVRMGDRMECGGCRKSLEFRQAINANALPAMFTCLQCGWSYILDADTASQFRLPKCDKLKYPHPDGYWNVKFTGESSGEDDEDGCDESELEQAKPDPHQEFKAAANDPLALPAELATQSGPEILKDIGGGMLTIFRQTRLLQKQLEQVAAQFQQEIEETTGKLWNMQGAITPFLLKDFITCPFFSLPVQASDPPLQIYGRFLIAPKFYSKVHGIPLGNSGGFSLQLLCPYSSLGNDLQSWLQDLLEIPPVVKLYCLHSRIVGESLAMMWRDIPGTIPASDHKDNSPAIVMSGDTIQARGWMVRHGCPGWRILREDGGHLPIKQDWAAKKKPQWIRAYDHLNWRGRLLFGSPERQDRLQFAQYALQCFSGKTAIICDRTSTEMEKYDTGQISHAIDWLDWRYAKSLGDQLNDYKVLAVEADAPYFTELYEQLYRYDNRLILLTGDPIFDMLTTNTWAPTVYGLVNSSHYFVRRFTKPYAWLTKSQPISAALQSEFLKMGFVR